MAYSYPDQVSLDGASQLFVSLFLSVLSSVVDLLAVGPESGPEIRCFFCFRNLSVEWNWRFKHASGNCVFALDAFLPDNPWSWSRTVADFTFLRLLWS